MAARLMNEKVRVVMRKSRVIAYLPSLRAVARHFRAFSSYDESQHLQQVDKHETVINDPHTQWPDTRLGPLGPQDQRFPMPGMIGVSTKIKAVTPASAAIREETDLLTMQLPQDRHISVLEQMVLTAREIEEEEEAEFLNQNPPSALDILECCAQDCPELIKKDFQDLFPDRDLSVGNLTVLTLSQKTRNDMTKWNEEVEEEREELLEHFVAGASEICQALHEAGYWADFVDPSSGRPYLGEYTNATLYETDERYRHFGFKINDLGCCKVISHHLWGTHAYIGSLFTNAPVDHPMIQQMVKDCKPTE